MGSVLTPPYYIDKWLPLPQSKTIALGWSSGSLGIWKTWLDPSAVKPCTSSSLEMHICCLSFGALLGWGTYSWGTGFVSDFHLLQFRISVFHRPRRPRRFRSSESFTFIYFLPSGKVFTSFSLSCFSRENDVAGIDVNMGCPKEYSTKVKDLFIFLRIILWRLNEAKHYIIWFWARTFAGLERCSKGCY